MRIAAVIPAFNETATVTEIVERTLPHAQSVIVVDDGSTDDTADRVRALPVTLIENDTNLGKAASLARGFAAALECSVDAVVTLDADGQHQPEDIPRLIEKALEYPGDMIIGARLEGRDRMPQSRRFGNRQADFWISWAAGYPIRDSQSGFRLYPSVLLDRLAVKEGRGNGFVFESQVLIEAARVGCYARVVPIDTIYGRSLRGSHYRVASDTTRIIRMVAGKLICSGLYPLGLLRSLGWLPHPGMLRAQDQAGSPDAMR